MSSIYVADEKRGIMNFLSYENFSDFKIKQSIKNLWIFDIDDTLYPHCEVTSKLRLKKYIEFTQRLGVLRHKCKDLVFRYSNIYGSAMKGLTLNFEFSDWHFQQLDNPAKDTYHYLNKDFELNNLISQLDGYKMCLTNGCINHAKSVLEKLELTNVFSAVVCCDFKKYNFICKPEKLAFEVINRKFKISPRKIFFYDDREVNVMVAKDFGWNAYLVDKQVGVKNLLLESYRNQISLKI